MRVLHNADLKSEIVSTTAVTQTVNLTSVGATPVCNDFKEMSEENSGRRVSPVRDNAGRAEVSCPGFLSHSRKISILTQQTGSASV